ncbi:hypothetical protein L0244_27720, partial [bacterium]|nr:hypothetical protein [bacterium]
FVFTENDPYFGVDQDNVRDPVTGIIEVNALKIAEELATYTEISCSETGCHHVGKGKLNGTGKKDESIGLEVYDRGRGFIFTGDIIPDFPITIEDRQTELDALIEQYFSGHSNKAGNQKKSRHVQIRTEILRLRNAGIPKDQTLIAACNLAESLNAPGHRVINEKEVSGIVDWVYSRTAQEYLLTEGGLADRFFDLFGNDIKYCYPTKSFYVWDGARYAIDRIGAIESMAAEMIRGMYAEATNIQSEESRKAFITHVKKSDSAKTITDLLKLVRSKLAVLPEHFDNDPYLLNCRNGVLNLKNGDLLPHDRNYLMTKLAPVDYDPTATHPLWTAFIET